MFTDKKTFEDLMKSYDFLIKNKDDATAAIDFVLELVSIERPDLKGFTCVLNQMVKDVEDDNFGKE